MSLAAACLALWDETREAFRQHRVWERARRMGLSQLMCLERHTITELLCTCGRQFEDWSADYRLFSKDAWNLDTLFRPIVRHGLNLQPDPKRLVVAIDDTLLPKSSKKTPGVGYRRDPLGPPFQVNLILAQRFLQFSLLVPEKPGHPAAARAVPCRFVHAPSARKPKKEAPKTEWTDYRECAKQMNLNMVANKTLVALRDELDKVHGKADCHLALVVDGSYTNRKILRHLPNNTILIGRIRKDAKLHFPHDQRPRQYGPPTPTPEELQQDENHDWQEVQAYAAGKVHTFRVKTLAPVYWRASGLDTPLRVVVVAPVGYRLTQRGRVLYRQPAYLICTDPDLPVQQLLQEYLWRWDIEVNHRDEKQIIGVGQAQVWSPKAVDRQPGFAVASYAMLLIAAMSACEPDEVSRLLPLPKWQKDGAESRVSTQRLIQLLRYEIWGRALEEVASDVRTKDFVSQMSQGTKSPALLLAPVPPIAYARTG